MTEDGDSCIVQYLSFSGPKRPFAQSTWAHAQAFHAVAERGRPAGYVLIGHGQAKLRKEGRRLQREGRFLASKPAAPLRYGYRLG